jgi:hypothetical protein
VIHFSYYFVSRAISFALSCQRRTLFYLRLVSDSSVGEREQIALRETAALVLESKRVLQQIVCLELEYCASVQNRLLPNARKAQCELADSNTHIRTMFTYFEHIALFVK